MKQAEEMIELSRKAVQNKRVPIYAFLAGNAISYVGDILTLIAIPWFVLQTTGSVIQTGITAFFSTLPSVCSAFFGGALVDRLGYKRTSVIGDIISAIAVMLIPLLYHTVGLAFWELLALVFLGGLLKSPGVTARFSMVPDLAEMAGMRLERANALFDGVRRVSSFIGAPLAGVLIAVIGTSNLLWLDALSFIISALLIGLVVPSTGHTIESEKREQHYMAAIWEGLHYIRRDTLILSFAVVVMITNMLDEAYFAVVAPAYIKHVYNSALPLGLLSAALGGAAFVGTLIFSMIGHRLPRRLAYGLGYMIGGSLRMWMLLLPILPIVIGWNVIAGLAVAPLNPIMYTLMQARIPAEMRARVYGTVSASVLAGMPLGAFIAGFVVSWIGLQATLVLMGALYLAATLSLLVNPAMRGMDSSNYGDRHKDRAL